MKLYIVEGMANTDLEGMIFATCTTEENAKKALKMTCDGEDVQITPMIADSIILDNEVVMVGEPARESLKEMLTRRYIAAIKEYFNYSGDTEGRTIKNYIMDEYRKLLEEEAKMPHEDVMDIYGRIYSETYGGVS